MNEKIDIAFIGVKMATRDYEPVSIPVHGLSVAYNITQMKHYRIEYLNSQKAIINGLTHISLLQQEQHKREMIKHSILTAIDITSLILMGMSGLQRRG